MVCVLKINTHFSSRKMHL